MKVTTTQEKTSNYTKENKQLHKRKQTFKAVSPGI